MCAEGPKDQGPKSAFFLGGSIFLGKKENEQIDKVKFSTSVKRYIRILILLIIPYSIQN